MTVQSASSPVEPIALELGQNPFWYIVQAIIMIIAGAIAVIYPLSTTVAVVIVLGWVLIVAGIAQAVSLIGAARAPSLWGQAAAAVLYIVVGALVLRNPGLALNTLTVLFVVFFAVAGSTKVAFALTARPMKNWGWVLLSGVVGIALSVYLFIFPLFALWLLGVVIGIQLISEGIGILSLTRGPRSP